MRNQKNDYFDKIEEKLGSDCPPELKEKIVSKMNELRNYTPKIGVFGKTGVGKSSLCNALFGHDICEINDIEACTREPQEVLMRLGSSGLKLVDVPGVGESCERDQEYLELYKNLLPKIDLIFWVFKGDDRAASSDEQFFKKVVRPYIDAGKPFLAVINQVDKVEPYREWDVSERKPGPKQATTIEKKRALIAGLFCIPLNKVIAISAQERFGLMELVDSMVHELPKEQKVLVLEKIKEVDDAEIQAAKDRAAKAEQAVAMEKAKSETIRLENERIQRELQARAQTEANELEKLRLLVEQQKLETERIRVEAERKKAVREAEETARKEREVAEERERNRNVSSRAEQEAKSGLMDVVFSVGQKLGGMFIDWLKRRIGF